MSHLKVTILISLQLMQASSTVADTFVSSPNDLCHADLNELFYSFFMYWWTSQNSTSI